MINLLYALLVISFLGFVVGMVGRQGHPEKRSIRSIETFKRLTTASLIIMLASVVLIKILG